MKNPWEKIRLSDYENHMKIDTVMQLQAMNEMMKMQFYQYDVKTITILGIAGGNGLEHINPAIIEKVYGVDINEKYLKACQERYSSLKGILECLCADLTEDDVFLPCTDMVLANLLIEYIGYQCFQKIIRRISPVYVSAIIQINTDLSFVSVSPYRHAFDGLDCIHHEMNEKKLILTMEEAGYFFIARRERTLPNGKKLVELDFKTGRKE